MPQQTKQCRAQDKCYFTGPLCLDDSFSGKNAWTTTCLCHRAESVLSDEMSLRDVTGRGPSPVVYICTNVVDERTHKIKKCLSSHFLFLPNGR